VWKVICEVIIEKTCGIAAWEAGKVRQFPSPCKRAKKGWQVKRWYGNGFGPIPIIDASKWLSGHEPRS
jgi:hypothetical protein